MTKKEHPYTQLKEQHDHLMDRTWQLFKHGMKREHELETAIANAWKYLGVIAEMENLAEIKDLAKKLAEFMAETLSKNGDEHESSINTQGTIMRINKEKFEEELNAAIREVGVGLSFEERVCIWDGPGVQAHLVVTCDESQFLDEACPGLIL